MNPVARKQFLIRTSARFISCMVSLALATILLQHDDQFVAAPQKDAR
jgi:hypothetical protein